LHQYSMNSLCLACSSSPSARKSVTFTTACCNKPICSSCLDKNPRLRDYNPCIACLAGVAVVSKSTRSAQRRTDAASSAPATGDVYTSPFTEDQRREQETFVVGDDEDESDIPPPYSQSSEASIQRVASTSSHPTHQEARPADVASPEIGVKNAQSGPSQYYIQPGDTLIGIAFKFGVDGRHLCKLNSLPPSTLSTTPHLLHTRTTLTLPPGARGITAQNKPSEGDETTARRRVAERAAKRLQ